MPISFTQAGVFSGIDGGQSVLQNPTSLEFGPDGRLYVSEQNGTVNAFTVALQNGEYIATAHEELLLPDGSGVVKSLQNHNDDGSLNTNSNRQVTGILVAGTASEPVLYISSSDPRISKNGEVNLDTNSGVLTQVSWNSATNEWEAVDLIRGLPRSEENHAVNGMVLSPDGTKLYLTVGGNTNNGAPSAFFSYTAEYALSGAILEVDLDALDLLPTQTDPNGGQGGTPRSYKYDLPTLDDPNIPNDGVREDAAGLDTDGPWGGNDGLNMAILPGDAPLRVFADGLRNNYDIALTPDGKLYTVDNGSNGNLGDDPNTEGAGSDLDMDGVEDEALNTPNNGGSGDPEPLFLIEEGGYYGHPNPTRANQNQSWTVYNDNGAEDGTLGTSSVPDISALVPASLDIADGFLIDPSKFAGLENLDPNDPGDLTLINSRLFESGVREKRSTNDSNKIVTVGSSTNGIVAYNSNGSAFDGVLDGKLFVTQFNDNVTLLNLNDTGDGLTPVLEEGPDGIFGTADDVEQAGGADGILEVANNALGVTLLNPLDVTVGPDGTLWVAEIGGNEVTVLAPSVIATPGDDDSDDDGILNVNDPFLRDPSNGTSVTIIPGQTYLWDFDANQDGNLPGPDGFGGGLTGVMIDGNTDFEEFLQAPSSLPEQIINLDNVKFITAAGGGTTVIEKVSEGDPANNNSGEFLFHTGVTLSESVGTATINWSMFNPVGEAEFDGPSQQIGAYLGTGDQANYLKVAAVKTQTGSVIEVLLENNDTTDAQSYEIAAGIFDAASIPTNGKIFIELLIDVVNETATPVVTYETNGGIASVPGLTPINLAGSTVLSAIKGNYQVQGQDSGLAVGLFSSNNGQGASAADRFQAIFDDIEITATETQVAPTAENDEFSTGVNAVLTIPVADLLANDTDPNPADNLAVSSVANALNGTVLLDDNGTVGDTSDDFVTFTPDLDFTGSASFDYTITDGTATDMASVSIDVGDAIVLYRVNAGGNEVAALASDPDQTPWAANPGVGAQSGNGFSNNTGNLSSNSIANQNDPGARDISLPDYVPYQVFSQERWDPSGLPEMVYSFDVTPNATYEVNLFLRNGFQNTSAAGQRIFDIEIEDTEYFSDIDLSGTYGHQVGAMLSQTLVVTDNSLDIEFLHQVENPLINAIEIVQIGGDTNPPLPIVNIVSGNQVVNENENQVFISLITNFPVPTDETVNVTFQIEPINATPGTGGDYEYSSSSATFGGGVYTDMKSIAGGSSDLQIPITILSDDLEEVAESFKLTILSVSPNATLGGDSEATVTIQDDDTTFEPGDVLFRINAGGALVNSIDGGPDWDADQSAVQANGSAVLGTPSAFLVDRGVPNDDITFGFQNGSPSEPGVNTTNAPEALFVTERFSALANPNNIGYAFDVANGNYTVNLYFDELFFNASGSRVFDVEIENTLVLDDFDTFATYGNDTGVQSFSTAVTDGELNIEFLKAAVNNPHVAAIEIIVDETFDTFDSFNAVPPPGNDFSDDNANPDDVTLSLGSNTLVAQQNPGDNDYVTFEVPAGQQLIAANLLDYEGGSNATFLGIETGDSFTSENDLVNNGAPLEGGTLYDSNAIGTDLLPFLASNAVEGDGTPTTGLSLPLGPGLYTLWFGQNGTPASTTTLDLVTEEIDTPQGPSFGLDLLNSLDATDGIATGGSYAPGQVGAAELDVLSTNNNIQKSNFGADSFKITNTGDKKIAAVFIDFRDAVFGDSVVDFDGSGGDTVTKEFAVNSDGGTGAFFDTDASNVYYLPGDPPLPNNTGTGQAASGGFRGLLLKASGTVDSGFTPGEIVGFSGDMDPNSIAGLPKGGIDSGAINNWDVGGISGAEIVGSQFFVLFDDGSTASGVLGNSGTQAGAIGQAVEGQINIPVTLTVNGGSGEYGGTEPTIAVDGPAGQKVLVTLSKGLQPVTNAPYEQLVEDRLTLSHPEFQVNNAFDIQTVEITIGQNGTALVPPGTFNYNETDSGVQFSGDDIAPIAISAVAINNEGLALGQVSRDYLSNPTQTPVGGSTPAVNLSVTPNEGNEIDGTVITVTASASASVSGDQTVDISLSGTGITAADFVESIPAQITIPNGQTEASFTLTVANDAIVEGIETATFSIDNPSAGLVLGATTTGDVTITEEEEITPVVNLAVTPAAGNESDSTVITVSATASTAVSGAQTIDIALSGAGITATDFVESVPTQITIPDGQTEASFMLTVANDAIAEGTETATFSISNPSTGLVLGTTTTQDVVITDGSEEPSDSGYFEPSGTGNNLFYKIQVEDNAALNGGTDPNGKWNYLTAPDNAGRQDGFQGTGYYLYGSNTSTSLNQVVASEVLEFEIDVPETLVGKTMAFRIRVSRDGTAASDQQNDAWFNLIRKDGSGSISEFLVGNGDNVASPVSGGFIKIFGGPNNGSWGYTSNVDGSPNNFTTKVSFTEAGRYVLQLAGRSQGFHIDWLELYKTGAPPSVNAANSTFISDGPPMPAVSITAIQDGAEAGEVPGEFSVALSQAVSSDTVISYSVSGTATSGSDYAPLTGQVTILANQQTATISVPVIDDTGIDPDETVTVTLDAITSGDPSVVLGNSNVATLSILDDEISNSVNIAATSPTASEPSTNGQFTVSLDAVATTDTVISYTVTGSATAGSDYETLAGQVTIPANQTSATIDVIVEDDALEEGTESVVVTLTEVSSGDANVLLGTATEATVTILDDDQPLTSIIIEAESSTDLDNYRVENDSDASGGSLLSFSKGSANETGSASYVFNGPSGLYNVVIGAFDENDGAPAATLEVAIANNTIGTVVLDQDPGGNSASQNTKVERSVAQVFINNGELITVNGVESGKEHARFDFLRFEPATPPVPEVSISAIQDGAEAGEVPGEFSVALSQTVSSDTVISYSVSGTATSGSDYTPLTGQVTILANQPTATISVPVIDDADLDPDETVTITLDSVTAGDPSVVLSNSDVATLSILDNEISNSVNIAATSTASEPSTNGQFTVSLDTAATTDTVISYTVAGSATAGDDYEALSGQVTISANQTFATIDVIVEEDTLVEGTENIVVTLNNISAGDADVLLGTETEATVIINDDDVVLAPIRLEAEAADLISGDYIGGTEGILSASGGTVLSFVRGSADETGSASFIFNAADSSLNGTYDLTIGTYDENDGQASFSVDLTDSETGVTTEIGNLLLNSDLGSNVANSQTAVSALIASGVQLTSGDTITVNGFENGKEHARFDYIDLTPTI